MNPLDSHASNALDTELRSVEAKLREAEQLLSLATNVGALGVWHYEIQRDLMACDDRWYEIVGHDPTGPRVNCMEKWRQIVHPDDRDTVTEVDQTSRVLLDSRQPYNIQFRIVRPDGEVRWVRSSACVFEDSNGAPARAVGFIVDITEWWRSQQRERDYDTGIREQVQLSRRNAMIDPLTGIANRLRFDIELRRACANAAQGQSSLTLAMIRVDNLARLSDQDDLHSLDTPMAALAEIVASAAWHPYDFVARYSASTIALLMPETSMPEVVMERIAQNAAHLASPAGPLELSQAHFTSDPTSPITPETMISACERLMDDVGA